MRSYFKSRIQEVIGEDLKLTISQIKEFIREEEFQREMKAFNGIMGSTNADVNEENILFAIGSLLIPKDTAKCFDSSIKSQVDLIKDTISSFSPAKLELFRNNSCLKFLLKVYI